MLSTIPHQIITQQAENTTITWPIIPTALRTYHPHYIEKQEEELQQANAENTAEKPSGNKATIVKNAAQLSKIPQKELQQANAENTTEKPSGNKATIVKNTAQLSKIPQEEQEEELQQANAKNTTEKPSGNKATIVKNTAQLSKIPRHMLSTIPHQIITQQAENTTTT
ncbi:hypothetical protein HO173_009627 [Letharia columbiana]|uniref:Uncharacterized protein n=1 Tax=Letharia columbiana TaxID=112416 RepID=A0A8H6FPC9_9LECA|nr:uncharacterized protein HO173_009627 [Letharia columbiana]KAF6232244.1 hypothetical protein HO173_009627 [Letharia columbiana]